MLRQEDYNKGLIYTSTEDCIDCNKCIHECPILKSNVSVVDIDGNYKLFVDENECTLCGTCLDTCVHDARHYSDDFDDFFSELKQGKKFSVLIAPAFFLNYPKEYKNILGYLKSLGVNSFYPVSYGADIAIWSYIKYLKEYLEESKSGGFIAQPCPTIVRQLEKHFPELLPNLIPIQSPMMCLAIYLKKYKGIEEDLVFLSPCISKKIEIESDRGLGLVRYNVTFKNIMEHIKNENVQLENFPQVDRGLESKLGSLFPTPGGIRENLEFYLGRGTEIIAIEGERKSYEYLTTFADRMRRKADFMPTLVDILNCDGGCSYGTGTEFRRVNDYEADYQAIFTRKRKFDNLNKFSFLSPTDRVAMLNDVFKELNLKDFICEYDSTAALNNRIVSEDEIEEIFETKLFKQDDIAKTINCSACGYLGCREMAIAIAYGINRADSCVFHVKDNLAKSIDEISEAEDRMRAILDNMPLVVNMTDKNLNMLDCNEEAPKLFGLRDKQEYMSRFTELWAPVQPDGTLSMDRAKNIHLTALKTGYDRFEWLHQNLNGEPIPCEVTLVRINRQGEVFLLALIRDLREHYKFHENKRLLEQQQKEREVAEKASHAKTRFLANMSHEIRTPMNSIMGVVLMELQKENHPPETLESFQRIYNSSGLLLNIINDILDLSKVEEGKIELNVGPYETTSLIVDTLQLNLMHLDSGNIDFHLTVDEKLPSLLIGDELRIKQVLNNLITNAFKYTAQGEVALSFAIEDNAPSYSDDHVMLSMAVSDTGQGMTEDQLNKIFDAFSRLENTLNIEGAGLGLSITKALITMMNGYISVDSEQGCGSTFTVRIPQKLGSHSTLGKEAVNNLQSFEFLNNFTKRTDHFVYELMPYGSVLIVDDLESNLYVAKGLLQPYQLTVDTAYSGFETLEIIKSGKEYDVIFMDQMMPQMDGIETVKIMRERGYEGTIVALTANALVGSEETFIMHGFDWFLSKPIDIKELDLALLKFVRAKYPEEAEKYRSSLLIKATKDAEASPELMRIIKRTIDKTIVTLRETLANDDIKLFTITVHAMKATLSYINENELSGVAAALENAGQTNNVDYIHSYSGRFIESLEVLSSRLQEYKVQISEDMDLAEDAAYLAEQLRIVNAACENFDIKTATLALDRLLKQPLKKDTLDSLQEIRDVLYLDSNFEIAKKIINTLSDELA